MKRIATTLLVVGLVICVYAAFAPGVHADAVGLSGAVCVGAACLMYLASITSRLADAVRPQSERRMSHEPDVFGEQVEAEPETSHRSEPTFVAADSPHRAPTRGPAIRGQVPTRRPL